MGVLAAAAIGAGISAVGGLAASAIAQGQASGQAANAATLAKQTGANATAAAQQANTSQQTQATNQAQGVQSNFAQQAAASGGLGNQSSTYGNLGSLAGQLQGVASGQGPNPAQAMLAQQTGANTANQAALMAGQRGAGANIGLMGRQAAMQGGANQQNAIGQGATLQAQQSLGALGQEAGVLGQQAGIAGQQVGQQMAGNQQAASTALGNQAITSGTTMQGAGMGAGASNQAAGISAGAQGAANQMTNTAIGGVTSGLGAAAQQGLGAMKSGASSPSDFNGSYTGPGGQTMQAFGQGGMIGGPKSYVTHLLTGKGTPKVAGRQTPYMAQGGMAEGGKVAAMVSPTERYLPPKDAKAVAQGKKDALVAGMKIKGKAKFKGDDYRNDTVSKNLTEGGVVIPKSVLEGPNPHREAYKFVNAVMAKSKAGK